MGVHLQVKLQFFLELDHSTQEEHFTKKRQCSNNDCQNHKPGRASSGNFCQTCGNSNEDVKISIGNKFMSPYEFIENHVPSCSHMFVNSSNECNDDDDCYWIYNRTHEVIKSLMGDFEIELGGVLDLTSLDLKQCVNEFKQEPNTKLIIDKFEEVYGKGTIQAKIGIISEYN